VCVCVCVCVCVVCVCVLCVCVCSSSSSSNTEEKMSVRGAAAGSRPPITANVTKGVEVPAVCVLMLALLCVRMLAGRRPARVTKKPEVAALCLSSH
jgi:hypothetical protein